MTGFPRHAVGNSTVPSGSLYIFQGRSRVSGCPQEGCDALEIEAEEDTKAKKR